MPSVLSIYLIFILYNYICNITFVDQTVHVQLSEIRRRS